MHRYYEHEQSVEDEKQRLISMCNRTKDTSRAFTHDDVDTDFLRVIHNNIYAGICDADYLRGSDKKGLFWSSVEKLKATSELYTRFKHGTADYSVVFENMFFGMLIGNYNGNDAQVAAPDFVLNNIILTSLDKDIGKLTEIERRYYEEVYDALSVAKSDEELHYHEIHFLVEHSAALTQRLEVNKYMDINYGNALNSSLSNNEIRQIRKPNPVVVELLEKEVEKIDELLHSLRNRQVHVIERVQ